MTDITTDLERLTHQLGRIASSLEALELAFGNHGRNLLVALVEIDKSIGYIDLSHET